MRLNIVRRTFITAFAGAFIAVSGAGIAAAADPVVFAAASLKNALDAVNAAWKQESGKSATISYAASSALARQIEEGAPADIFISADLDWMKYLNEKKLTKPETEMQSSATASYWSRRPIPAQR